MKTYSLTFYKADTFDHNSQFEQACLTNRSTAVNMLAEKLEQNIWWMANDSDENWDFTIMVNGAMYHSTFEINHPFEDGEDPGNDEDEADAKALLRDAHADADLIVKRAIDENWHNEQAALPPKPGPSRRF